MTGSNLHRLNWPRLVRWLLKMDSRGGLPQWWQWIIPRYGNWGAPGWSSGAWVDDPANTDWSVEPTDAMDELFRHHDRDYQEGELWIMADLCLVAGLHRLEPLPKLYGKLYRLGAIVVFATHAYWMMLTGNWHYLEPLSSEEK